MRSKLAASLGALAIAVPVAQAAAVSRAQTKAVAKKTVTRKATGIMADANQWGTVQVVVTAKITTSGGKKTVRYSDLGGRYSYTAARSHHVAVAALPGREFLSPGASMQLVSGSLRAA
jgi:hypothetical protein